MMLFMSSDIIKSDLWIRLYNIGSGVYVCGGTKAWLWFFKKLTHAWLGHTMQSRLWFHNTLDEYFRNSISKQ